MAILTAACAAGPSPRHPAPGAPEPVPWADTLPIPEPETQDAKEVAVYIEESFAGQIGHGLSLSRRISGIPPALNVTAFDEVVPSAWFEHRIGGGRGLSPREAAEGPPGPVPDTTATLRIVEGKVSGVTPGFTVEDARGNRWLLKFDPPGMQGLASGADVVSSRIFWSAGYRTARDVVTWIDPGRLELAEDAVLDATTGERPLTRDHVDRALEGQEPGPDGRIRVLASLFLDGTPKGPFRFQGRREDDPNDHYPHEDRRELRGMFVLGAWVNHVDLRWENTLDTFQEPGGWIEHNFIDFATTLGSGSIRALNPWAGREHTLDLGIYAARFFTAGLYQARWEGEDDTPIHPALGWMPVETYRPGAWKPYTSSEPYRRLTDRDAYWGAKLVAAFTPAHIRAIVAEARYPAEAADTLVDILLERQRRTVRHWFARVTPVEEVEAGLEEGALALRFLDLGLEEGLWSAAGTRYRWRMAGTEGELRAAEGGRQRLRIPLDAGALRALEEAGPGSPVRLELRARREGEAVEPRAAHLRLHSTGAGEVVVTGVLH